MDAGTLQDAISEVCPVESVTVGDPDDRATWSFVPGPGATQAQIDAGNNVIATIPIDTSSSTAVPAGEFIARWTNAEYKALQLRRTSDNGKTAKDFDTLTAEPINMTKKRTQGFKADCVSAGILTQARADEIFV